MGPRCQRAVTSCPAAASTASAPAKATQNESATRSSFRRDRIEKPPVTITASASTSHHDVGPHQKSSGSACDELSSRKHRTSPMFDGLKMWLPRTWITYLESSEIAAVAAKIHQPRADDQSPCTGPGTR